MIRLRKNTTTRITTIAITLLLPIAAIAEQEAPNIIVIMADDLGWMDLRCQGNNELDTPQIDRLATQGIRFTSGYAAAPVCTPTRAALMTGIAPARLQITNHAPGNPDHVDKDTKLKGAPWTTYLSLDHRTLAEHLRDAGYATGFVGKWHLSHRPGADEQGKYEPRLRPEHQGFDLNIGGCSYGGPPSYFEPYRIPNISPRRDGDYLPDRLADECIQFLESNRKAPFFLCWWNYSVHYPIEAPEELVEKYKKRGVENPGYAAMIEGMDRSIGRVLERVDTLGLGDNTLLVFTSDNGSLFGVHPLRRNKGFLYEGGIRVPWIIRWPGVTAENALCDTPIVTTDLFPTILEATGIKPDPGTACDGESLIPVLSGQGALKRNSLYFHYPNYAFHKQNRLGSAMRQGKYKLIHWYDDDSVELYDLDRDHGEKENLAKSMPELTAKLRTKLETWLQETGAKAPTKVQ